MATSTGEPVTRQHRTTGRFRLQELRERGTPDGSHPPPVGLERDHPGAQRDRPRWCGPVAEAGVPIAQSHRRGQRLELGGRQVGQQSGVDPIEQRSTSGPRSGEVRHQRLVAGRRRVGHVVDQRTPVIHELRHLTQHDIGRVGVRIDGRVKCMNQTSIIGDQRGYMCHIATECPVVQIHRMRRAVTVFEVGSQGAERRSDATSGMLVLHDHDRVRAEEPREATADIVVTAGCHDSRRRGRRRVAPGVEPGVCGRSDQRLHQAVRFGVERVEPEPHRRRGQTLPSERTHDVLGRDAARSADDRAHAALDLDPCGHRRSIACDRSQHPGNGR